MIHTRGMRKNKSLMSASAHSLLLHSRNFFVRLYFLITTHCAHTRVSLQFGQTSPQWFSLRRNVWWKLPCGGCKTSNGCCFSQIFQSTQNNSKNKKEKRKIISKKPLYFCADNLLLLRNLICYLALGEIDGFAVCTTKLPARF